MDKLDWARYGLVDPRPDATDSTGDTTAHGLGVAADELARAPIEFLWNGKSNGEVLLAELEQWLIDNTGITSLGQTAKLLPNTTAPQQLIIDLAARARMVVTGPGD